MIVSIHRHAVLSDALATKTQHFVADDLDLRDRSGSRAVTFIGKSRLHLRIFVPHRHGETSRLARSMSLSAGFVGSEANSFCFRSIQSGQRRLLTSSK